MNDIMNDIMNDQHIGGAFRHSRSGVVKTIPRHEKPVNPPSARVMTHEGKRVEATGGDGDSDVTGRSCPVHYGQK